jgi:hypothetical protein
MENWPINNFSDFLEEERRNCYWFWFKGKITQKRNKETGEIYEQNLSGKCEWNGIRLQNGFNHCFNILTEKYMRGLKERKYNGQTKSEFEKNYKRVKDIVDKSSGDVDKAIVLSKTQANRITDEWKAINRAMAAKQNAIPKFFFAGSPNLDDENKDVYEAIFETFFHRAYELGSVSKQEYRDYKLEKLGL